MSSRALSWALILALLALPACTEPDDDDSAGDDDAGDDDAGDDDTADAFIDDCTEALNEVVADATPLVAEDGLVHEGVQLCEGEFDVYRLEIPAETYAWFAIHIDGSGDGAVDGTDLDLGEADDPDDPIDPLLDLSDYEVNGENIIGGAASEQPQERLAWYNATAEPSPRYVGVMGKPGSAATYTIEVRTSELHPEADCDECYGDTSDTGPCNQLLQFPAARTLDEGYVLYTYQEYCSARREQVQLIRHATAAVLAEFPGAAPLGLSDMSQHDGDTPGADIDDLRHPKGTHVWGNDVDIAYYSTGAHNLPQDICPEHDGDFCTGDPTLLDAERTAYLIALLLRSPGARVVGVDPAVVGPIFEAAGELRDQGLLDQEDLDEMVARMGYGPGWPKHFHHLHFSWQWEEHCAL